MIKMFSYLSRLHKRLGHQRYCSVWYQPGLPLKRIRWAVRMNLQLFLPVDMEHFDFNLKQHSSSHSFAPTALTIALGG